MSVIQQQSNNFSENWRTINIDLLDPESACAFNPSNVESVYAPVSDAEIIATGQKIRQLLRGGDAEGALRSALESTPYGSSVTVMDIHLGTVVEVLQSIKASDMAPLLKRIDEEEDGAAALDTLMKYLYKGMATYSAGKGKTNTRKPTLLPQGTGFSQLIGRAGAPNENSGAVMSVLLSWHEKVVEKAGLGCIGRCMTDWRKV